MPVVGRGRGKFRPSKLFGGALAAQPCTPISNGSSGGGGWGGNNGNNASTDAWGNLHSDSNTDRFADSGKEVELSFNVFNSNLARIIGKQGSNIQSMAAETSATIDIDKRGSDGTTTLVTIKGSQLNCDHAKKMIDEICTKFNGMCDDAKGASASAGGGGGFGGMAGGADDGPTEDEDIWIPEDKCGRVIGRGGSKIQEIQEDSGANVKVHGRETAEDGKVMVTLSGSPSQRAKAKEIIERCTADRGAGGGGGNNNPILPPDAEPLDMWVESGRIGRVVGKGGSKIREIQETFNVRVDIKKEEVRDDDTMVVLTGSPEQTQQAKDYIDELTERSSKPEPSSGGGDDWDMGGGGGGGDSAPAADSGWGGGGGGGGGTGGGWDSGPAAPAADGWGAPTGGAVNW